MRILARRLVLSGLAAAIALSAWGLSGIAAPAQARARTHAAHGRLLPEFLRFPSQPKYAAIVIDAQSGEVLFQQAPDEHRYPASITKVMTMYLAFEAIHAGRLSFNDQIVVSPHAAAMIPSKLGLRPGQTISVADAMNAIAVISANDMAVALAEKIGGTEGHFAELMTAKAKQLGMNNSQFVNASGLPDNRQLTTARDIAILSRAVLRDYPKEYAFFGRRELDWHGQKTKNHNHLLGTMPGVDGIKTGFTNASGFNLAASAVRDNHRLIAVVMGGSSTAARDTHVQDLLEAGFIVMRKRELGQTTTVAENLREPAPVGVLDRPPVEQGDGDQGQVHIVVDGKAPARALKAKAGAPDTACTRTRVKGHRRRFVTRCAAPAAKGAAKAEAAKGPWAVQLGAYKSPAMAQDQLSKMNKAFPGALASGEGRVDHAAGNYRVRVAGLSAEQARDACASIKAKGQDCLTLRP